MRRSAILGILGIIGSPGLPRARAWTWDFSSTHSTTALQRSAIDAPDQYVAFFGVSSKVATTTAST